MDVKLNDKTYTTNSVKARIFRKAVEINEKKNFNDLKVEDFDELVDFVVELYGNQFTRDEFYDGLESDKLIITLVESITRTISGTTEKMESKNE